MDGQIVGSMVRWIARSRIDGSVVWWFDGSFVWWIDGSMDLCYTIGHILDIQAESTGLLMCGLQKWHVPTSVLSVCFF